MSDSATPASSTAPSGPLPTTTGAGARAQAVPSASATMTITTTNNEATEEPEVLRLTLRSTPGVRWDESVVDNEGLGRKSSKRCCIFHKQRRFDESSTDSSDQEDDGDGGRRPIARPKGSKKVPDYQRFHA